jgi:predicted metal-dependent phosphoesterase TrpH
MVELSAKHRDTRLALLRGVDGLETFNARNYSPGGNWLAHRYAVAAGLRETAGSDAHAMFELGLTWTEIDAASAHLDDLLTAFKHGKMVPHAREELDAIPVPGYTARRAVASIAKKIASGFSSAFPPFKHWLSTRFI